MFRSVLATVQWALGGSEGEALDAMLEHFCVSPPEHGALDLGGRIHLQQHMEGGKGRLAKAPVLEHARDACVGRGRGVVPDLLDQTRLCDAHDDPVGTRLTRCVGLQAVAHARFVFGRVLRSDLRGVALPGGRLGVGGGELDDFVEVGFGQRG